VLFRSPAQSEQLLDELLPVAGQYTATQLSEKLTRIAYALDPDWAEHRYQQAVRDRKVVGYLNRDGSATLAGQNLPADDAAAAGARVDALADAAKRAGAAAKIDHLRADIFLGLLNGRFTGMTQQQIITELRRQYPKPATDPEQTPLDAAAAPVPRPGYAAAPSVPPARPTAAVEETEVIRGAAPETAGCAENAERGRVCGAQRRRTAPAAKNGRPKRRTRRRRRGERDRTPRPPP